MPVRCFRARSVAGRRHSIVVLAVVMEVVALLGGIEPVVAQAAAPATVSAPGVGGPVSGPLRRAGTWIVDGDGRVFVGHGTNIIAKAAPFYPASFGEADAAMLAREGFTVVRTGFIWEAVEPQPGVYDDAYVDRVLALDDLLARHGIRTIIDVHQDLWSAGLLSLGDGAPQWATKSIDPNQSFAAFWRNEPAADGVGILDHFTLMWRHLAQKLRTHTNVLAIDPFNEPAAGSDFPGCGLYAACPEFERTTLGRVYDQWVAAIREGGAPQVVLTEGVPSSVATPPALPAPSDPQAAFSYHFYCTWSQLAPWSTPVGGWSLEAQLCQPVEQAALARAQSYAASIAAPAILGEFSCNDINPDNAQMVDAVGRSFTTWTQWAYYASSGHADCLGQGLLRSTAGPPVPENVKQDKLDALVVPHAQAIAGTPLSTDFDRRTRAFILTYGTGAVPGAALSRDAVTQIFVPQRIYPAGYRVQVDGATVVSSPNTPWLLVKAHSDALSVTVTVLPATEGK